MQHRLNTTGQVQAWIRAQSCWHLDVWLYRYTAGETDRALVLAETRAGGDKLLGRQWVELRSDGGAVQAYAVQGVPDAQHLHAITLASPIQRAILPTLERDHAQALGGLADLWPRGDFKRRSVRLHYIVPTVPDPTEGMANAYGETGRAARDDTARLTAAKTR